MSDGPACWIHLSARTIAFASACTVFGFLSMKPCGAYRQAAGIGPPKTRSASATMRVSLTIFRSPERCSSVITGSRLLIASIWPERTRDHVGAAADHGLQRTRAAGEVGDGHAEAFGLEVTEAFGNRQRQVIE